MWHSVSVSIKLAAFNGSGNMWRSVAKKETVYVENINM